jgi:hypothetical protein
MLCQAPLCTAPAPCSAYQLRHSAEGLATALAATVALLPPQKPRPLLLLLPLVLLALLFE